MGQSPGAIEMYRDVYRSGMRGASFSLRMSPRNEPLPVKDAARAVIEVSAEFAKEKVYAEKK